MIELQQDRLVLSFPKVHPHCKMSVDFQRTLRIPDDGSNYPLPPGLGRFPLRHVDDHADGVPQSWGKRGGVMLPMYASEALWLSFSGHYVPGHDAQWPFALKIAAGKINAVDGEDWSESLIGRDKQDYLAIPEQPWLDGFYAGEGVIRQFVAMAMGGGYTVEEQLTGKAEHGGLQLVAFPMKRDEFMRRFPKRPRRRAQVTGEMLASAPAPMCMEAAPDMGLAAGGTMHQEIYDDEYGIDAYDLTVKSRSFVHLCNSMVWRSITGSDAPTVPPTATEYEAAGLPWFEYYSEGGSAKKGETPLDKVKSVVEMAKHKGQNALPENKSVAAKHVIGLHAKTSADQVREGEF